MTREWKKVYEESIKTLKEEVNTDDFTTGEIAMAIFFGMYPEHDRDYKYCGGDLTDEDYDYCWEIEKMVCKAYGRAM